MPISSTSPTGARMHCRSLGLFNNNIPYRFKVSVLRHSDAAANVLSSLRYDPVGDNVVALFERTP